MSKFNCQVGEAIEFPRQKERRFPKKDKCCGFVGAVLVAHAVITGRPPASETTFPAGRPIPFMTNASRGFHTTSTGKFTTESCGTFSVTLKARPEAPGLGNDVPATTFQIIATGCGQDRVIDTVTTEAVDESTGDVVSASREVCLKKGESIQVVPMQNVDLNPNESITLFLSVAKISDCCDENGLLGDTCRSCSCDKCRFDKHDDHHHSDRCDRC